MNMVMVLRSLAWLFGFVALLWAVTTVDLVPGLDLAQFGVVPRDRVGLRGIPLHVFIHSGYGHLLSNSIPLLILGGLASIRGERFLIAGSAFIVLFSGALVWLVGRSAIHIGASGLVFGLFGYLAARGFIDRGCLSIVISVVVISVYGLTIFLGLLPLREFVSWEAHLFGLIGGIAFSWLSGRRGDKSQDSSSAHAV